LLRRLVIAVVLVGSLLMMLGAGMAAVGAYRVHGASMRPTLAAGDLLLVNPLARNPVRFAVVVYDVEGTAAVKRVVGLSGDRVRILAAPTNAVQVQPGAAGAWQTVVDATGGPWPSAPHPALTCCAADGAPDNASDAASTPLSTAADMAATATAHGTPDRCRAARSRCLG
jgi:type IV secretory pathway protease TraF